jgi:hypothetical protein
VNGWVEIERLPVVEGFARRQVERAAAAEIVHRRLGADTTIGYNKNGAPVLGPGAGRGYISVSHTKGWIALVWSPEPCAIDIELKSRALSAGAADRYNISSIEDWCALEARYKFAGLTGREPDSAAIRFLSHPELIVAIYVED